MGKVIDRMLPAGAPEGARYIVYALLVLSGVGLLLLVWGLIEPYLVDWHEVRARVDHLPQAWRGRRIAAFGDMQIGSPLANKGATRDIVDRLIERRPDVVLLLGDFIYKGSPRHVPERIEEAVDEVAPLVRAGIPTFAVLGNHDYQVTTRDPSVDQERAHNLTKALEAAGIRVLHNEGVALAAAEVVDDDGNWVIDGNLDEELYIVGVGSHEALEDNAAKALADVPTGAARFVAMHHPQSFLQFPAHTAPAAVCGHTHGGQARLPGVPKSWYKRTLNVEELHLAGWAEGYGQPGNHLYVNRGIGFGGPPIRINARPEVTIFVLDPADGEAA